MNRIISNQLRLATAAGLIALAAAVSAKGVGDWSTPASIEAQPGSSNAINTPSVDGCASHSPDGLTLAFNSDRTGNHDIYLATRASTSEGFGDPVRLPAPINSTSVDACPTIARGKRLYFTSFREDPAGDLYVSRLGPKGWSTPSRLGPNVNTGGALEEVATFYEDNEGREVVIFTRRIGPAGKLYQSIEGAPATLVQGGPHSSASDLRASVTHDGRTIYWDSTRSGSLGGPDIWYAIRSNTTEPWGQAIHVTELSSPGQDLRPFINWDGNFLTMSSTRTGSESPAPDIWFTSREQASK